MLLPFSLPFLLLIVPPPRFLPTLSLHPPASPLFHCLFFHFVPFSFFLPSILLLLPFSLPFLLIYSTYSTSVYLFRPTLIECISSSLSSSLLTSLSFSIPSTLSYYLLLIYSYLFHGLHFYFPLSATPHFMHLVFPFFFPFNLPLFLSSSIPSTLPSFPSFFHHPSPSFIPIHLASSFILPSLHSLTHPSPCSFRPSSSPLPFSVLAPFPTPPPPLPPAQDDRRVCNPAGRLIDPCSPVLDISITSASLFMQRLLLVVSAAADCLIDCRCCLTYCRLIT